MSTQLYFANASLKELVGKSLVSIEGAEKGSHRIDFICSDGTEFQMFHMPDSYENVEVEDVAGDVRSLIGTPLVKAEVATNRSDTDTSVWYFYHLATIKGYVTIRWFGDGEGYYSDRVDFIRWVQKPADPGLYLWTHSCEIQPVDE